MLSKLKIYGLDENALKWMSSYLKGRTQRTKIGEMISEKVQLHLGLLQGGNLSPLAFVIYVSDLEVWLEFAIALTYADNTSTSVSAQNIAEVIRRLEIDAVNVRKFMTSNGLVTNEI